MDISTESIKIGDVLSNIKIINIDYIIKNNRRRKSCDYQCLTCYKTITNVSLTNIINGKNKGCRICASADKKKSNLTRLLDDNCLSWYYIGLLLADGSFGYYKNIPKNLVLELHNKDKYYLEKFADFLETKVHHCKRTRNNGINDMYYVSGGDRIIIAEIMKKYDISPRKTYNPPNPSNLNWSYEQQLSIAIGFIDGDGSRNHYDGFYIKNHKLWLNMHKYMFKDIAYSSYIDNQNFFHLIYHHMGFIY